jgi:hypothetical protein
MSRSGIRERGEGEETKRNQIDTHLNVPNFIANQIRGYQTLGVEAGLWICNRSRENNKIRGMSHAKAIR